MSTARTEPPCARQVPTLTCTAELVPLEVGCTGAVPENAGEVDATARGSDPVASVAGSTSDVSRRAVTGVCTLGNVVTPAHVPAGSGRTDVALARLEAVVGMVVLVEVAVLAPAAPAPGATVVVSAETRGVAAEVDAVGVAVDEGATSARGSGAAVVTVPVAEPVDAGVAGAVGSPKAGVAVGPVALVADVGVRPDVVPDVETTR